MVRGLFAMTQNDPVSRGGGREPDGAHAMSATERRGALSVAAIIALRMLGLFLLFPVLSLHAGRYPDATPVLVGLAIGVHGLTQALFQIPFGTLSDRIGRKPIIAAGLLVFVAGSVVAALADTLHGVVVGRALQGVGAIGAAATALAADLTSEQQRTKAMAAIGIAIAGAFVTAQVLGPLLAAAIGLSGLFWLVTALALACLAVLGLVPEAPAISPRAAEPPRAIARVLADRQLLRLDLGVLVLHGTMTALFVVLPLALRDGAGLAPQAHWTLYAGAMLAAVCALRPAIAYGERSGHVVATLRLAAAVLAAGAISMGAARGSILGLGLAMAAYFTAFIVLEATLPSLVSRLAPATLRGTALAAFSTAHFAGTFAGGVLGGWLLANHGVQTVFNVGAGLAAAWILVTAGLREPPRPAVRSAPVPAVDEGPRGP